MPLAGARFSHGVVSVLRVRFVHWNQEEAEAKAQRFEQAGSEVDCDIPSGSDFFKELEKEGFAALVIDLSRIPSQGRDLAVAVRRRKSTRRIPILFVGGKPTKVN